MTDFEKYIQRYLDLIPEGNWIDEIDLEGERTFMLYSQLTEEQSYFAYDEGKWTLKELLQHLIDTEKVFAYRALRFARNDQSLVSGFDENLWADQSFANDRTLENLVDDFAFTRKATLLFFQDLREEVLAREGSVNGNSISVETLGKLIIGHNIHHCNIIEERYFPKMDF